jgi:hypothetical protein
MGEQGWRPVRQPWGYWERQGYPPTFGNNEPVGIGSSVASDDNARRLICAAVVTWIAGGCAHVVHTGAGIYGAESDHPVGGHRPTNLWEQPSLSPTLRGIAALRSLLPADLSNWARQNHYWTGHPFAFDEHAVGDDALANNLGCVRAYAATKGGYSVCLPIGVMQRVTLTPKQAMRWATYNVLDGTKTREGEGPLTLTTEELILGAS